MNMYFDSVASMDAYCESQRDADRFCRVCNGCSGPSQRVEGIYEGGFHGSCRFEVETMHTAEDTLSTQLTKLEYMLANWTLDEVSE